MPFISRLGFKEGNLSNLSEYEMVIAAHLVVPEDISVSWKDIAGLDSVVQELKESVVLPGMDLLAFASIQNFIDLFTFSAASRNV